MWKKALYQQVADYVTLITYYTLETLYTREARDVNYDESIETFLFLNRLSPQLQKNTKM